MSFWLLAALMISLHGAASECPKSVEQWGQWRNSSLRKFRNPLFLDDLTSFMNSCKKEPGQKKNFENAQLKKCMERLTWAANFIPAFYDPEKTYEVAREENYYDLSKIDFKELVTLPKELEDDFLNRFFKEGDPTERLAKLAALKKKFPELKIVTKTSIMALIPGEDYDRWFDINDVRTFMLAIQKKDKQHKLLERPLAYYNNFTAGSGGQRSKINSVMLDCSRCHRAGAVPVMEHTDTDGEIHVLDPNDNLAKTVEAMNSAAHDTSKAINARFDKIEFKPTMGERNPPSRTMKFLRQCSSEAGNLSDDRLKAIGQAMNCSTSRCHGGRLGALGFPQGVRDRLVDGLIRAGHMPPGADDPDEKGFLSPQERLALSKCLMDEYYGGFEEVGLEMRRQPASEPGVFMKYLLEEKCPQGVASQHQGRTRAHR